MYNNLAREKIQQHIVPYLVMAMIHRCIILLYHVVVFAIRVLLKYTIRYVCDTCSSRHIQLQ